MTRQELIKNISKRAKIALPQAEKLVDGFCSAITNALKDGQKVVYSNFGTFYTRCYPSKVIFHPRLGEKKKMIMLPTNVIKWMPSGNIKDLVNLGIELDNATAHGVRKHTLRIPQKNKILSKTEETTTVPIPPTGNSPFDYIGKDGDEGEEVIPVNVIRKVRETQPTPDTSSKVYDASGKGVSIYEERMNDGSKVESTFGDAIKVYKNRSKPFWQKVFRKNKDELDLITKKEDVPVERISLQGAGLFDAVHNVPPLQKEAPAPPQAPPAGELPVKAISQNKTEANSSETFKELKPFSTDKSIEFIDLSSATIPKELLQKIPEKIARQYKIVPVSESEDGIMVAMSDPQDIQAKEMVKKLLGKPIVAKLASEEDIGKALDQYMGIDTELTEALEESGFDGEKKEEKAEEEKAKEASQLAESVSDSAPAARIVTSLLRKAIRDKASDIHIEPTEKSVSVRFRKDGILQKSADLPKDIQAALVSRIKILSNLKIDEQRLPQDGRFSINFENRKIDFRISTLPTANGEKVVIRILDKLTGILTIEKLGFQGKTLESLHKILEKSHGMILVTGPTGSGKTTTLYALLDKLFSEGVNIVTLEDPIEYRMPGINQSQVNQEINYTFASGLRSIVRQDPDIIMIGEIRDAETAEMAVHAALTGHVVLSTLHTNDSAGAAPRLIDMGIEPFLITSSINAIIAQRLARKICESCRVEEPLLEAEVNDVKKILEGIPKEHIGNVNPNSLKFFKGKGCKSCSETGYKGRIGLYELFTLTDSIKDLILQKQSSSAIEEEARKEGMITMLQDGVIKALQGVTTIEEVKRITQE